MVGGTFSACARFRPSICRLLRTAVYAARSFIDDEESLTAILFSTQGGGVGDDSLFAAAVWSDGSSIVAGDTDGNWSTGNSSDATKFGVDGWATVKVRVLL